MAQLATSKVSLDQAVAAHDAGTSPKLDVLRAQVDYQNQQQSLISTKNNFEKDKLTFAIAPFTVDTKLNRRNIAALPTLLPLDEVKVVCTAHGGCTPEADTRRMLDELIKKAGS